MIIQTPSTFVYTLAEVQALVLQDALKRSGVSDPSAFIGENAVSHMSGYRLDAGVMWLTLLSCSPVVLEKKSEPEVPINLKSGK